MSSTEEQDCTFTRTCNNVELYGWWWLAVILIVSLLTFAAMTYGAIKIFNLYCKSALFRSYKNQDLRKISRIRIDKTIKNLTRRERLPGDIPLGVGGRGINKVKRTFVPGDVVPDGDRVEEVI